jgi:hypothetical protein
MIVGLVLLLDRQKTFQGDLNPAQQMALAWIINNETKKEIDLEKLRATNMGLATNPATSREFLIGMLQEAQKDQGEVEYVTDKGWTTPRSIEEIEEFLKVQKF